MVGICSAAEFCSVYKKGECLGCDCDCIIKGTDEADFFRELELKEFWDYNKYDY